MIRASIKFTHMDTNITFIFLTLSTTFTLEDEQVRPWLSHFLGYFLDCVANLEKCDYFKFHLPDYPDLTPLFALWSMLQSCGLKAQTKTDLENRTMAPTTKPCLCQNSWEQLWYDKSLKTCWNWVNSSESFITQRNVKKHKQWLVALTSW